MIRKKMREWLGIFDIQQMVDVSKNRILSLEMLSIETNRARKNDSDSIREQIETIRMNFTDEISRNESRIERIDKEISDLKKSLETGISKADYESLKCKFDNLVEFCRVEGINNKVNESMIQQILNDLKDHQHDDILKSVMEKLSCRRKVVKGAK